MARPPVTEEILDARAKLLDLRMTMDNIKLRSPSTRIGNDPSATDACRLIFEAIEWHLHQLEVFVG